MHDRDPSEEPVVVEDVHGVPVGEVRHQQRSEACEGRLVVECGRQRLAGFCEHGQTGSGTLGGREGLL